jgi:3-hydroxyisobutyrate dehydrogenase
MTTMPNQPSIAFLGLGAMGQRIAARLVQSGHALTVWNRSEGPTHTFKAQGVRVAESPREAAARADVVISMVFDDAASQRVWMAQEDGALRGLKPGGLAVEMSTLTPAWIVELSKAVAQTGDGAQLIDAPVVGSRLQAEAGQLIFLAGGAPAAVKLIEPLLLAIGAAVHRTGPSSSGAWLKLAVNALFGTQVVVMAEQLALLRRAGMDMQVALAALKTMPVLSPAAAGAAALMLAENFNPQAPVDLMAKDLSYALQSCALDLPLTQTVLSRFQAASKAGHGHENLVAVSKLYA